MISQLNEWSVRVKVNFGKKTLDNSLDDLLDNSLDNLLDNSLDNLQLDIYPGHNSLGPQEKEQGG